MSRSRVVNLANFQQFTAINFLSDPGSAGGPKVIPNCVEVTFVFDLEDAKRTHCVLHASYTGGFTPTTAIANNLHTTMSTTGTWTALAAFLATTNGFVGVTLRDLNVAGQPLVSSTTPAAFGTSASTSLPNEVALVVTLRTALAGRGHRGRFYMPGFASNALGTANVANAATVTALQTWANSITANFGTQGITLALGLPHRIAYTGSTGTAHADRPAHTEPITALIVRDNHWDTQRRRGLK